MPRFASKPSPTSEKLRGGYYTPDAIARFLAAWVAEAGPNLLEPSCGDGSVLRWLARSRPSASVLGVELVKDEADKAEAVSGAPVHVGDFFEWFGGEQRGAWNGVAGNPPYIRFGNWPENDRKAAFELMSDAGLRPNRLTNAWVPFTVGAVLALCPGGRLGLVVPAELLQVTYAAQLRQFLADELSEIRIVTFRRLVFDGILQEVVLLLGVRGQGPAVIQTADLSSADDLLELEWSEEHTAIELRGHEKWTKFFLGRSEIDSLRRVRDESAFVRLGDLCDVDVGVVTGRNSFFTRTPSEAREHSIDEWCMPLVARSSQLRGIVFDDEDLAKQQADDVRSLLLVLEAGSEPAGVLQDYLSLGEAEGVPSGYKCSIRKDWWSVPSVWRPDAFMLRQLHTHPRMIVNHTGATSTDTVHRIRFRGDVDGARLAAGMINSATFAMAEVVGRSYGGGILELEPREAEDLLVPAPEAVPDELVATVDEHLRSGSLIEAVDLVDRVVLVERLGLSKAQVQALRRAWATLRDRRTNRGRSSRTGL